ncbi:receptor-like protein 7 [Dendrobium catenatum]|uniref:receptor-like protein 7 n=1 Tax=Dendrobium catenatum TaxID=906689 RepID=UPI00109FE65E|nr:receptor-like protein 7 [Dendrobium catenatum]
MELFHFKFTVFLLLLLFLELFLINCDAAGRCLEEENSALLQLKKGFITRNLETWQPGTDCCIWEGVTCDEYGRIIALNLKFRLIVGTIDPSLFNLTSLETLNLAKNKFDGIAIPDHGWDRLVNLSSLDLSYSGFVGKIPASISRLTKLNFLGLSCTLKDSLAINPMILQNMSSLKELHLDNVNVSSYRDEWCGVLVNSTPPPVLTAVYLTVWPPVNIGGPTGHYGSLCRR